MNKINRVNYPNKPIIENKQNDISKSITNIILFLLVSYLYFGRNLELIFALFIILIIHELGHFFTMRFYNYNNVKIFLIPLLGAYTTGTKTEISQRQSIVIYLAGPLPGIFIAIALHYYTLDFHNLFLHKAIYYMILFNLFNLLPVIPLDGGQILNILFFNLNKYVHIVFTLISFLTLILISFYLKSYILLIVPFFILINQIRQLKIEKIKNRLNENGLNTDKSYNELTNEEYWTIRKEILSFFKFSSKINPDEVKISEQENKIANYVKFITNENKIKFDIKNGFKFLIVFIIIFSFVVPIYYLKGMKDNYTRISENKTLREVWTNEDKRKFRKAFMSQKVSGISNENQERLCDCYIEKMMLIKKSDFDKLIKMPKNIQQDSSKSILLKCLKELNLLQK